MSPILAAASNAGASLGAPASAGKPVVSASAIEVVSTARFPAPAAAVAVGAAAASGTAVASAGASASEVVTAASEVVKASLVVETLMILGSLAKPSLVYFHSGLCGAPSVWGRNVQALLLWDVTGGLATGYHVPCVALQAFASADCSGVTAGRLTAPPPAVGNVQSLKLTTPLKAFHCVICNHQADHTSQVLPLRYQHNDESAAVAAAMLALPHAAAHALMLPRMPSCCRACPHAAAHATADIMMKEQHSMLPSVPYCCHAHAFCCHPCTLSPMPLTPSLSPHPSRPIPLTPLTPSLFPHPSPPIPLTPSLSPHPSPPIPLPPCLSPHASPPCAIIQTTSASGPSAGHTPHASGRNDNYGVACQCPQPIPLPPCLSLQPIPLPSCLSPHASPSNPSLSPHPSPPMPLPPCAIIQTTSASEPSARHTPSASRRTIITGPSSLPSPLETSPLAFPVPSFSPFPVPLSSLPFPSCHLLPPCISVPIIHSHLVCCTSPLPMLPPSLPSPSLSPLFPSPLAISSHHASLCQSFILTLSVAPPLSRCFPLLSLPRPSLLSSLPLLPSPPTMHLCANHSFSPCLLHLPSPDASPFSPFPVPLSSLPFPCCHLLPPCISVPIIHSHLVCCTSPLPMLPPSLPSPSLSPLFPSPVSISSHHLLCWKGLVSSPPLSPLLSCFPSFIYSLSVPCSRALQRHSYAEYCYRDESLAKPLSPLLFPIYLLVCSMQQSPPAPRLC
ncbi:unnamed protein product [Closterium sp. NIES-65]|nr:unnamed protein product [Closterium sp. NIES-65]